MLRKKLGTDFLPGFLRTVKNDKNDLSSAFFCCGVLGARNASACWRLRPGLPGSGLPEVISGDHWDVKSLSTLSRLTTVQPSNIWPCSWNQKSFDLAVRQCMPQGKHRRYRVSPEQSVALREFHPICSVHSIPTTGASLAVLSLWIFWFPLLCSFLLEFQGAPTFRSFTTDWSHARHSICPEKDVTSREQRSG